MLVWAIDEAEQVVLLCASMADVAPNQPSPVQFQQHRPSHRFHVMSLRLLLAWHGVEMRQRKLPFVIRCYSMSLKIPIGMFFLQERDSQLGLRVSEVKSINFYMLSWARLIISMDVMLQTGLSFTASVHMPPIFPFLHIGSIRGPCLLASTNISTSLVLRHLHFLKGLRGDLWYFTCRCLPTESLLNGNCRWTGPIQEQNRLSPPPLTSSTSLLKSL